jgi:hypothetical protein
MSGTLALGPRSSLPLQSETLDPALNITRIFQAEAICLLLPREPLHLEYLAKQMFSESLAIRLEVFAHKHQFVVRRPQ